MSGFHEPLRRPAEGRPRPACTVGCAKPAPRENPVWQTLAMRPGVVQPKLVMGQAGDAYEREADSVASGIMGGQHGDEASTLPASGGESVARAGLAGEAFGSAGRPLDGQTRRLMETRFGRDFGQVRVHTGGRAEESAQALNAHAYTVGSDIVFGSQQYRPGVPESQRLLAHELTHVLQQQAAPAPAIQREEAGARPGVVDVTSEEDWKDLYAGYLLDDATLKAAVAYNLDVQKGNNKKVGAEAIRHAQYLTGAGLMMPYDKGPGWDEILTRLSIHVATWQHRYLRNKDKSFKTDPNRNIVVDGRLTPDTYAVMKLNEPSKKEWAKLDREDYKAIRAEEDFYRKRVGYNPTSATTRQAIVDLAASQAGKVYADDRGDGNKYGWERIARYYEQAYAGTPLKGGGGEQGPDVYWAGQRGADEEPKKGTGLSDVKTANRYASDTRAPVVQQQKIEEAEKEKKRKLTDAEKDEIRKKYKHVDNWSWCAIFAVWAVRAITGKGLWVGGNVGLVGLGPRVTNDPKLQGAKRGDLLHIKDSPQNHHVVLAYEVPPDASPSTHIRAVEGNLDAQEIVYSTRWTVKDIDAYYSTVADDPPQATQQATQQPAAPAETKAP